MIEGPFGVPDRAPYTCGECLGHRKVERIESVEAPTRYAGDLDVDGNIPATMIARTIRINCPTCNGLGIITPADGDRVDVYQEGRKVGSCTVPARVNRKSRGVVSGLFRMRPGDFTPAVTTGRMIYIADIHLGWGDLVCLEGWRNF